MSSRETVHEAATRLLPAGAVFDCALPLSFVNECRELTSAEAAGQFVWLYDRAAPIFGRPFPLHNGALLVLSEFNYRGGYAYPVPHFFPEGVGHE